MSPPPCLLFTPPLSLRLRICPLPPPRPTFRPRARMCAAPDPPPPKKPLTQSERMKALWADPAWRAAQLARRASPAAARKKAAADKRKWEDPYFRARMSASRKGRIAWNRGKAPSDVTKLRMSFAHAGVPKSEETKRRMSETKLNDPDKSWKRRISESKLGRTNEYYQMRREYRALKADLRLWSDSYRLRVGQLPKVSNFDAGELAPMMVLKVRRYITLTAILTDDERGDGREILIFDSPGA